MPSGHVLALLCVTAFLAGAVDAVAGGGGLLTVPALLASGLPPHIALGTNKGQSVFGTCAATFAFFQRGGISRERVMPSFLAGLVGSACGAALLLTVPSGPLKPVIFVLLVSAATLIAARPYIKFKPHHVKRPLVAVALISLGLGAYDGFFGPGTGSLLILAFSMVLGDTMTRASGNAKVTNLASNVAAISIFAARGTVVWSVSLPMAFSSILGGFVGARLALSRGDNFVRWVVFAVVVAIVVKLGFDLRG